MRNPSKLLLIVFSFLFLVAPPLEAMNVFKRCLIALGIAKAPIQHTEFLPQIVTPTLQQAAVEMFEAGPNKWISTGIKPQGDIQFQRGFGGINLETGTTETLSFLAGEPLSRRRHAHDISSAAERKHSDTLAQIFSKPIAIKGTIPKDATTPINDPHKTNEFRINPDTTLSNHVTDIGIFYQKLPEASLSAFDATTRISWAKNYLEIYERLYTSGLRLNPESKGAKFTAELQTLFEKGVPNIPAYMSSQNGDFDRFYNQHETFITRLGDILYRYQ